MTSASSWSYSLHDCSNSWNEHVLWHQWYRYVLKWCVCLKERIKLACRFAKMLPACLRQCCVSISTSWCVFSYGVDSGQLSTCAKQAALQLVPLLDKALPDCAAAALLTQLLTGQQQCCLQGVLFKNKRSLLLHAWERWVHIHSKMTYLFSVKLLDFLRLHPYHLVLLTQPAQLGLGQTKAHQLQNQPKYFPESDALLRLCRSL